MMFASCNSTTSALEEDGLTDAPSDGVADTFADVSGDGLTDAPSDGVADTFADVSGDGLTDTGADGDTDTRDVPEESVACYTDEDCDDSDPCTMDECDDVDSVCVYAPLDADGDGHVAELGPGGEDCGGDDCDDADIDTYAGATDDACDMVDRDCDGSIDEAIDDDGDGWIDEDCDGIITDPGAYDGLGDCADDEGDVVGEDPENIYPGAPEGCDGTIDHDCDGDDTEMESDGDGDGHMPLDCGGDDCDDSDADIHPGAVEACDLVDDDCDSTIFDADGIDDDTDGVPDTTCGGNDCDDETTDVHGQFDPSTASSWVTDAAVSAAEETCNDQDDDCDGTVDNEGATGCTDHYVDADDDGVGDSSTARCLCAPDGEHQVTTGGDCNDAVDTVGDCSALPNVDSARCVSGACVIDECRVGYDSCDGSDSTGCETDLNAPTTCGTGCADIVDCTAEPSVDSDGSDSAYEVGGTVTDYTGCDSGDCTSVLYTDTCSGTMLDEYGASGSGITGPVSYDCESMEHDYCNDDRYLYHDEWDCSGDPGACTDATDSVQQDCGVDGCSGRCNSMTGCIFIERSCSSSVSPQACVSTEHDPDDSSTYCSGCDLSWNIGGEMSASTCCGDDREAERVCEDSSSDGSCGTGSAADACCSNPMDCVDHGGNCRASNVCYNFGTGGERSFCDSGTWESPDESSSYCEGSGCSYDWLSAASTCCGNDPGEDIEQAGEGRSCCYNDDELLHEEHVGAILCHDGELYNCEGDATDHSGLATPMSVYTYVEDDHDAWCTPNSSWCDWGLTDCSGDSTCETVLNTDASCTFATDYNYACADVLSVMGVPLSCTEWVNDTGRGEAWFTFEGRWCGGATGMTGIKAELMVPPMVDYDLILRTGSCGGPIVATSENGMSSDELLTLTSSGSTQYFLEIRYVAGISCGDWNLIISVHNCG
jgi:hypothetical protein